MPRKQNSLRSLAEKYDCSYEQIRLLKQEGINILDEEAVRERLSLYDVERTAEATIPLTMPEKVTGTGLRAAIQRLQASEIASHADYLNAIQNNPAQVPRFLKAWKDIVEQLRKVEESNPSVEKEAGKTITKEELAVELGELFRNLRDDLNSLPRKISLHSGKTKRELEAAATEEVHRIIDSLFSCSYL